MKIKNKGKVYPSPSPSPSPSSSSAPPYSSDGDFLSVLKLLPAAILVLVSILAVEDREVLAYMMTRSMKTSAPSFVAPAETRKKPSKKGLSGGGSSNGTGHSPPVFDCDCFDCYTSYWFRWDSSPNRELIHQAIEAFEDQLTKGEKSSKNAGKGKRREKIGRRASEKPISVPAPPSPQPEVSLPEIDEGCIVPMVPTNDVVPTTSLNIEAVDGSDTKEQEKPVDVSGELPNAKAENDMAVIIRSPAANNHKGLARKVLPDVLGLFNSRLWSLWGPN